MKQVRYASHEGLGLGRQLSASHWPSTIWFSDIFDATALRISDSFRGREPTRRLPRDSLQRMIVSLHLIEWRLHDFMFRALLRDGGRQRRFAVAPSRHLDLPCSIDDASLRDDYFVASIDSENRLMKSAVAAYKNFMILSFTD